MGRDERMERVLEYLDVSTLSYDEWLKVGFALHDAGYSWADWDEWSRRDTRYHEGECREKWETIKGNPTPITSATIIEMAKARGWRDERDKTLGWNDTITSKTHRRAKSSSEEIIEYLTLLFEPNEYVGYVTRSTKTESGKYTPCGSGSFDRKASVLIEALKKHPEDVGAVLGDYNRDGGAWIRINPLDGRGVKNENVTAFRYALVESDTTSLTEQEATIRRLNLPVKVLVDSGNKSLHAIVSITAKNMEEYRERVDFLYKYLSEHGMDVDTQNRNPSRLSRLPGFMRGEGRQRIIATNLGAKSWDEWLEWTKGEKAVRKWLTYRGFLDKPMIVKWLIKGWIPERGMVMLFAPAGTGKTFVALDMALSITCGVSWHNRKTQQGEVLYLAGEGHAGIRGRIAAWCNYHNKKSSDIDDRFALSEYALDLDKEESLIGAKKEIEALPFKPRVIFVDTLNRFMSGDENDAQCAREFLNRVSMLTSDYGATVVIVHHTGVNLDAQRRARGSSAFSGAMDTMILATKTEDKTIILHQTKQKDIEAEDDVIMRLTDCSTLWCDEEGKEIMSGVVVEVSQAELEVKKQLEEDSLKLKLQFLWKKYGSKVDPNGKAVVLQRDIRKARGRDYIRQFEDEFGDIVRKEKLVGDTNNSKAYYLPEGEEDEQDR